jgi:flagella synthesis protein FlgN
MAVDPREIRAHLARLLAEESSALVKLEQILHQETSVLRGDDVSAVEQIGSARHDCTALLTRLDGERRDACRMLSFGTGNQAIEKLLRWCDDTGALHRTWIGNLDIARRCRTHNERNGAVVSVKLNHLGRLLTTLRGGAEPAVYAAGGFGKSAFATRDLGQA